MTVQSNIDAAVEEALVRFADLPKEAIVGALVLATDVANSLATALSVSITTLAAIDFDAGLDLADLVASDILTDEAWAFVQKIAGQSV